MEKLYMYCISDKPIDEDVLGMDKAKVLVFKFKDLNMIYSVIDKELKYSENNFMTHEAVLDNLLEDNATILPFRFGTCMDLKTAKTMLGEKYKLLKRVIGNLTGKVEVGVRVMWDYETIRGNLISSMTIQELESKSEKVASYLNQKMKEYKIEEGIKSLAEKESEVIHKQLLACASAGKLTLLKTDNMFFNGVYLVKREDLSDFNLAYKKAADENSIYKFILTGPWPPYNFCNLTI
ncbi:MAG: GvpL/GvpF family gas vesicle protein [Eubacteriales bacterium]